MNGSIKKIGVIGATCFALLAATSPAMAMGNVMVTTEVTDQSEMSGGNVGCPKGPWGNAFAVDVNKLLDKMRAHEAHAFLEMVGDFEMQNGVEIQSKTTVRDMQLETDVIKTTAVGPPTDFGAELCSFAAKFI